MFYRTSFRDFFAAHYLHQDGQIDTLAERKATDRRWGGVITFAAGLRRKNSVLLETMSTRTAARRALIVGPPDDDYFYSAFLTGRVLANSESSDHGPKTAALRTCLTASVESVPEIEKQAKAQFGNIGMLIALIGIEHTFFVTVGVPWLKGQLRALLRVTDLTDEERYLLASTYANLGYDDCFVVLEEVIREVKTTRVLVALRILLLTLARDRQGMINGKERAAFDKLMALVRRRLASRKAELKSLWKLKGPALEIEQQRQRRLFNRAKEKHGAHPSAKK
jgi:hypothetical protein